MLKRFFFHSLVRTFFEKKPLQNFIRIRLLCGTVPLGLVVSIVSLYVYIYNRVCLKTILVFPHIYSRSCHTTTDFPIYLLDQMISISFRIKIQNFSQIPILLTYYLCSTTPAPTAIHSVWYRDDLVGCGLVENEQHGKK